MITHWEDWQETKKKVEQLLDLVRSDGFRIGDSLPDEQVDDHHKALQHLHEIDYLMSRMYVRRQDRLPGASRCNSRG